MMNINKENNNVMKAVVCYGPKDYRLETIPKPSASQEEVIIKVDACGICAADKKAYYGAPSFWGDPPWIKTPVVPGHEFIGEVVELGPGAGEKYGLEVGDRAISEQIVPDWNCHFCNMGSYWLCRSNNIYGFRGLIANGGMAEYMKFPRQAINHKVPKDIKIKSAVMIEPLSCAIHAVQRANIELQDIVVIAGLGPLGQCMAQVTMLKNPAHLILIDTLEDRLKLAMRLNRDAKVINAEKEDAVKIIKDITNNYGCDKYINATGNPIGVSQGLKMIRKQGTFVEFSTFSSDITVDWGYIGNRNELTINGVYLSPYTYPIAIKLLHTGKVKVDELISHVFPLDDYKEAFDICFKGKAMKVVLRPGESI
ncbi:MAG: alcohol dehydrogenase catalytic domain-containing protein [Actinobacteria bacterium]|nr:alcohol dehydrogenase catalytic domain-containing protein [Actinomycetota bacterium]